MSQSLDAAVAKTIAEQLVAARHEYKLQVSRHYDDVLTELSQKIDTNRSVGKADIGALVLWKRISASTRWASKLMALPESEVREITGRALNKVQDNALTVADAAIAGRRELAALPGFKTGDALASAVLFVAAPTRMAVYDRRAQAGLRMLGLPLTSKPGRYGRYMTLVEQLRASVHKSSGVTWQARDVDLALFWLGR